MMIRAATGSSELGPSGESLVSKSPLERAGEKSDSQGNEVTSSSARHAFESSEVSGAPEEQAGPRGHVVST